MSFKMVSGSMFNGHEHFLVHQCNCVTHRAAHLAASVFSEYPWADIYSEREGKEVPFSDQQPGDIVVRGDGRDERLVIAILGQYYPGSPKYPDSPRDGFEAREGYFQSALDKISILPDLISLAFPYGIGCGAAGGNWGHYEKMIRDFSGKVEADIVVYRL